MKIVKTFEIDSAHRILKHEGKCASIHGHRFKFEIHVEGQMDSVGRIVDFSVIKEVVGGWLNKELDHTFICNREDPMLHLLLKEGQKVHGTFFPFSFRLSDGPHLGIEPTSENLAREVLEQCALFEMDGLLKGATVVEVVCYETPTAYASYTLHDLRKSLGTKWVRPVYALEHPWYEEFIKSPPKTPRIPASGHIEKSSLAQLRKPKDTRLGLSSVHFLHFYCPECEQTIDDPKERIKCDHVLAEVFSDGWVRFAGIRYSAQEWDNYMESKKAKPCMYCGSDRCGHNEETRVSGVFHGI